MPEAVIVATSRTPIGRANKGSLVNVRPDDMAAFVLKDVLSKVPQLDPSLASVFGLVSLATTFVPDPFSIGLTAGGPVSASYLGGGCYGFATAAPTLTVSYAGGASLLRFYFIGSGDTTLLIRTPSGAFVCVDDSFGTLNPTLDFNSPAAGAYQVWNATYAQGASIGGTLFVTTNAANHP